MTLMDSVRVIRNLRSAEQIEDATIQTAYDKFKQMKREDKLKLEEARTYTGEKPLSNTAHAIYRR